MCSAFTVSARMLAVTIVIASVGCSGGDSRSGKPDAAAPLDAVSTTEAPASSPPPVFREVVVPTGTTLRIRLTTDVSSTGSHVEDTVRATIENPVEVQGSTAIPTGAAVSGSVLSAQRSGRVKGRAFVAFRFDRLTAWESSYDVDTNRISRVARATKRKDATKIGIGAGAGALVGAIAGGGKGAAVGGAIGAGAGTGMVMATRGDEVHLPAGTTVTTKLAAPLTMRVPIG